MVVQFFVFSTVQIRVQILKYRADWNENLWPKFKNLHVYDVYTGNSLSKLISFREYIVSAFSTTFSGVLLKSGVASFSYYVLHCAFTSWFVINIITISCVRNSCSTIQCYTVPCGDYIVHIVVYAYTSIKIMRKSDKCT